MTDVDELVAFIRARLDEDQANAWAVHDVARCDVLQFEEDAVAFARLSSDCDCGMPARVLSGVEAKRRILNDLIPKIAHADELVDREWGSNDDCAGNLVRLLAGEWSDHPDYRAEWTV